LPAVIGVISAIVFVPSTWLAYQIDKISPALPKLSKSNQISSSSEKNFQTSNDSNGLVGSLGSIWTYACKMLDIITGEGSKSNVKR